jgi:sigma-B regulation protein RsbU (phosphoserine phosphatase)
VASLDTSRLEALLESAQLLHASLDLDDLLRHLLRTVMGRLLVTRAVIAVAGEADLRVALARGAPRLKPGGRLEEAAAREAGIELLLPIGPPDDPVGLLGIARPDPDRLAGERGFLDALLGIAASGIANARSHAKAERLTEQLGQKVQELRALLELVRGFAATQEPEEVAQLLALTLAGRWAVGRYTVAAWMQGHAAVVRQRGMHLADPLRFEAWLSDAGDVTPVEALPPGQCRALLEAEHARLVLPIRSTAVRGFVALGPRPQPLAYGESDYEFGAALVAQAAVAFENAWRFRETLARKRVEQELALAASIQRGLFPAALPLVAGYELAAFNRPASHVGGDYYDALATGPAGSPAQCLLCVADVSGKGLPASLLMSTIQATLRALQARTAALTDLVAETSELLFATTPGNKYATAILVRLDPAGGLATYVNAGHARCLLVRADGSARALDPGGPPIGLLPGVGWEERTVRVAPGDSLVLFSDGVTEAWNDAEEEFGEDRLLFVLTQPTGDNAAGMVGRIVEAIDRFAGPAPQHDDITLLVVRRLPA